MLSKYEEFIAKVAGGLFGLLLVVTPFFDSMCGTCPLVNNWFGKLISFIVGAVILFCVVRLIKRSRVKAGAKSITVKTAEGESKIAIGALEGLLRDELCREKDVHDVAVSLAVDKESDDISCKLRFKLDSQPDIPSRIDVHKRKVREAFDKLIPSQKNLQIFCSVENIVIEEKTSVSSPSSGQEDFSGPVYPVPDDDISEGSDF